MRENFSNMQRREVSLHLSLFVFTNVSGGLVVLSLN